jgi:hypothetical protein
MDEPDFDDGSEESKVWMRSILPDETYGKERCDGWFNDLFLSVEGCDQCRDAVIAWFLVLFSNNLEEPSFEDFG